MLIERPFCSNLILCFLSPEPLLGLDIQQQMLRATDPLSHICGVVHAAGSSVPLASYQQLDSKHNDLQKHFGVSS